MATARKITVEGEFRRSMKIDPSSLDKVARTVRVQMSSEFPVRRRVGGMLVNEILGHSDSECDLSRVNSGTAVCLEHNMAMRCGITEGGKLTGNGTSEGLLRFSKTPIGDQAMNEVEDGTLRWVSAGYTVSRMVEQDSEDKDGIPNARATSWQIFEVSLVGAPADPTCRIRSAEPVTQEITFERSMKRNLLLNPDPAPGGGGTATATVESPEIIAKRNRERTTEILKIAEQYRGRISDAYALATTAIEKEQSPSDFARFVIMPKLETAPIPNGSESVQRDGTETASTGAQKPSKTETRSFGELLVSSAEYRELIKKGAGGLKSTRFNRTMDFPDLDFRATLTTTVSGLTKYERPPGIVLVEQQELTIADLLAEGTTENTTIRYMQEDTYTNAATALAEEGTYAEASWDLSEQDAPIKKSGVIGRVTEEIFADSSAIQSYVNARLPFMVKEREELHLLSGTGLNNQITGILSTTGIQTLSAAAYNSVVTAIHKAITKVRVVGRYQPTAIVMNPYDWENIKLMQDANGQYIAGGPFYAPYGNGGYSNVMMLWGLPCISTTNQSQGTAVIGAWKLGAQLWRRKGLTIESTNTDASDFANDRIAIKVGQRFGLSVYRPSAFCTVTAIPA